MARIGVRLDGKRPGKRECKAVPNVCGVPCPEDGKRSWLVVGAVDAELYGGICDWMTRIWPCGCELVGLTFGCSVSVSVATVLSPSFCRFAFVEGRYSRRGMFRQGIFVGSKLACMRENTDKSFSRVERHSNLLSAADRLIMGLAVPERRKSASLTELMKESWTTAGAGPKRLRCGADVEDWEKCTSSRNGGALRSDVVGRSGSW